MKKRKDETTVEFVERIRLSHASRLHTCKLLIEFLNERKFNPTQNKVRTTEKRYRIHHRSIAFDLTNIERKKRIVLIWINNIRKDIKIIRSKIKMFVEFEKIKSNVSLLIIICMFSSCATILGGTKTEHQTHKPVCGETKREVRVGYLIADILFCPVIGLIVDFSTGKIYKKEPGEKKKECDK